MTLTFHNSNPSLTMLWSVLVLIQLLQFPGSKSPSFCLISPILVSTDGASSLESTSNFLNASPFPAEVFNENTKTSSKNISGLPLVTSLQYSSSPFNKTHFNTLFSHFTVIVLVLYIFSSLNNHFLFGVISNAQLKSRQIWPITFSFSKKHYLFY